MPVRGRPIRQTALAEYRSLIIHIVNVLFMSFSRSGFATHTPEAGKFHRERSASAKMA
jgi:hypothetical protein